MVYKQSKQIVILCLVFTGLFLSMQLSFNSINSVDDYGSVDEVEITVLLDNYPNGSLQNPWGVSFFIEIENYTILFDAGIEPDALGNNSLDLGKDINEVDFVIISHEHADHYYGLEYVAEVNPGLDVYVPNLMLSSIKVAIANWGFNVVNVLDTTVLFPGVAIIGQIFGPPYEHALAINVENVGLVIIVGCSHPGVENIATKAVEDLSVEPYLVIGGFHLMGETVNVYETTASTLLDLGTDYIYPIHCSGDGIREYIERVYPDNYREGCVGTHLVIDQSLAPTASISISSVIVVITFITIPIFTNWLKRRRIN
ncbi:MAG: MBL fold metallo-hydrolase [Asgard group archaeon]|nr:MBL fold metallo-hydrolase [Asgard group archaeon]